MRDVGAELEVTLAGDVTIRAVRLGAAGVVRFPVGQARVAFALLALERQRGVDRATLADVVWPDGRPATWPSALRGLVSRVRSLLTGIVPEGGEALTVHAGHYRLHLPPGTVLDVEAAERLVVEGQHALAAGDPGHARRVAAGAVTCLRAPFLPGHDGHWVARRREGLVELLVAGLDVVSRAATALGDPTAALVAAAEAVDRAPLRESAHRSLVVAHAAAGNRGEALRAYQRLRRALADELGVDPTAETEEVYLGLLGPPAPATTSSRPDDRHSLDPTAPASSAAATRDVLSEAWERARGGGRCVALVPKGLVAERRAAVEVARRASAAGGLVLTGDGDRQASHAYGPLVDALGPLLAARFDDLALSGDARAQLARLLPTSLPPDAGLGAAGPQTPTTFTRVADAVADCVAAASADRPVLVVLDDSRWAEPSAVRLLRHVLRHADGRGLLVLAFVHDGLPADHHVSKAARMLESDGWLHRASPDPLLPTPPGGADGPGTSSSRRSGGRAGPGRLPAYSTSFVGRSADLVATSAALQAGRLVTLVGVGGVGKTRLAVEVARHARLAAYPDGVRFCDVSLVADRSGLADAVHTAIGTIAAAGGVTAPQGMALLLVVDNCEFLRAEVATLVDELLAAAPESTVLATSRAPLLASGEWVVPVRPLGLPTRPPLPADADADAPALRLLVDRARAAGAEVDDGDPALAEVAYRLDGIPLAIELAAPRLASMPAGVLARSLERPLDVLVGATTGPARQRTLRATVEWSCGLLDSWALRLFAALSAFRGGWTLETAAAVAPAVGVAASDVPMLVAALAEQSIVRLEGHGRAGRYDMLGVVGAYAAERLVASGRSGAVSDRHSRHFVALAEAALSHRRGAGEGTWVSALDAEFDNLRAAFRSSVEEGRPVDALRVVAALADDVMMRDRLEVGRWAEEAAHLPAVAGEPLRVVALAVASNAALAEDRLHDAHRLALDAVDNERRTGAPPCWVSRNILALLTAVGFPGPGGASLCQQLDVLAGIAEATGDPLVAATIGYQRVLGWAFAGRPERGLPAAEAVRTLGAEWGNPTIQAMGLLAHAAAIAPTDLVRAVDEYAEALAVASSVGNTLLAGRARRAIEELEARSGHELPALANMLAHARRSEAAGNMSEQLQTVVSMLGPLAEAGDLRAVATICGGLAGTPWRLGAACRAADAAAGGLPAAERRAARHAGAAMSSAQLVAFTHARVEQAVGAAAPAPS